MYSKNKKYICHRVAGPCEYTRPHAPVLEQVEPVEPIKGGRATPAAIKACPRGRKRERQYVWKRHHRGVVLTLVVGPWS